MRQKGTDVTTKIVNGFYADDLRITIDERGDGRPVLLLHGGGGPPTMEPLTTALCDDFRVIAPVHPGFDGTPRPGWFDAIDDIALSYLQLLEPLAKSASARAR
jgi:pimeloyl-ACP methyl ester carboxylesterase